MEKRWSLGRITRADALVVGVACLFLLFLVPVLLAKPREQSVRRLCGANLAQIGKTMFMYAEDHNGALPRAGGPTTMWGVVPNWMAPNRFQAFGLDAMGQGGSATINSCFYLLVKYYKAPPRLFLCRDDKGTTEFKLSSLGTPVAPPRSGSDVVPPGFQLADAWDFGPIHESYRHCSYAYQIPFNRYALTTARDPNLAVAADRNPFLDSPAGVGTVRTEFIPDLPGEGGNAETARESNAITHGKDGQNVLFLDGRVTFEKRAYCGLDNDNIYLVSMAPQRGWPTGAAPAPGAVWLLSERDSVLIHDPASFGVGSSNKKP